MESDKSTRPPAHEPTPLQPTPITPSTPVAHPDPTGVPASKSKGLAITALVLAIVSVVIGLLWFIAAPIAIVAIILAIVSLAKQAGGKGRSITAIVIGGISLTVFVPFWALVSLILLSGIQQASQEYQIETEQQSETQPENTSELFN